MLDSRAETQQMADTAQAAELVLVALHLTASDTVDQAYLLTLMEILSTTAVAAVVEFGHSLLMLEVSVAVAVAEQTAHLLALKEAVAVVT